MAFVYPLSFGVDEGLAHLFLRAEIAMNTQCAIGGCTNSAFAVATTVRWVASMATSFWLVLVFRRYEVSVALPIEYGTVTAVDVISGLVFFREYEELEPWRVFLIIAGCGVCIIGVMSGLCCRCR
mmetsp:Transcript_44015/g.87991  ORF Transcript_44015/g.87991 Transcript_44015/m.87991 type:complete len:125 (-) Transcript_44015:234-608(-)